MLHATKIWRKSKAILHGYRQLHQSVKTENIYVDISKGVERRFDSLNYDLDSSLPTGKTLD